MYDKVDFGPKWHFDPRHPSQIGLGPKTVILGLKTLKKHFLSIFHLWHLKSTLFCYQYHFFLVFLAIPGQKWQKNENLSFLGDFDKTGFRSSKMGLRIPWDWSQDSFQVAFSPQNITWIFWRSVPEIFKSRQATNLKNQRLLNQNSLKQVAKTVAFKT